MKGVLASAALAALVVSAVGAWGEYGMGWQSEGKAPGVASYTGGASPTADQAAWDAQLKLYLEAHRAAL